MRVEIHYQPNDQQIEVMTGVPAQLHQLIPLIDQSTQVTQLRINSIVEDMWDFVDEHPEVLNET